MIARIDQPSAAQQAAMEQDTLPIGRPLASWPVWIVSALAVLAAVHIARDLLIPITFAVLLALLLRPLLRRMKRVRMPDALSALVLIGAIGAVFGIGLLMLAGQAQYWLKEAPQAIRRVSKLAPTRIGPIADLQKTSDAVEELTNTKNEAKPLPVEVQSTETATTVLGVSGHFIGATVIVLVLAYFLLAFSDTLLKQALGLRSRFDEKRNIVELLKNIEGGISRYLLTITVINIGLGVATALTMWAFRVPNPILWGVMAATLNYVPHVGAFLCMVVMFFVGAVSHESLWYGALLAGAFMLLTSAESYFITPYVLSKSLQLSPLAVLLAILFGGWMWGIAGGLMAAPLLTIVKIVCDQFESLHRWAAFLAGEPRVPADSAGNSAPATSR